MRVGDIAVGRAGDKGDMLDLTLVAPDDATYHFLSQALTTQAVALMLNKVVPGPVLRYDLPGLTAFKFVLPEALMGGVFATLRPGLPWTKAAIWLFQDLDIPPETLAFSFAQTAAVHQRLGH